MQEVSKGKDFGGEIRQTEGAWKWVVMRDTFNPTVEFLANGCTKDRVHIIIETLIEVAIAIKVALKNQLLCMLCP